jgi:DNA-directed RNA polymerase I subunit RPA1
LGEIEAQGSK